MGLAGSKSQASRVVRGILASVAAAFVIYAGIDLVQRWNESTVAVSYGLLALALPPALLAALVQMLGWRVLVRSWTSVTMPFWPSAKLYFDSQMARYTPGKVGLPAVRIAGAGSVGVSGRAMGTTLLVEVLSWAGVGLLVGFGSLALLGHGTDRVFASFGAERGAALALASLAVGIAAFVGLVLLCALPRRVFPAFVLRALSLEQDAGPSGRIPLVPFRLPLYHVVHWSLWVTSGALVAGAVGAGSALALSLGAALVVAMILGFLALLAPAGVGIREAVLMAFAVSTLGAAPALALGILTRVVSLFTDVGLWAAARTAARSVRKEEA